MKRLSQKNSTHREIDGHLQSSMKWLFQKISTHRENGGHLQSSMEGLSQKISNQRENGGHLQSPIECQLFFSHGYLEWRGSLRKLLPAENTLAELHKGALSKKLYPLWKWTDTCRPPWKGSLRRSLPTAKMAGTCRAPWKSSPRKFIPIAKMEDPCRAQWKGSPRKFLSTAKIADTCKAPLNAKFFSPTVTLNDGALSENFYPSRKRHQQPRSQPSTSCPLTDNNLIRSQSNNRPS